MLLSQQIAVNPGIAIGASVGLTFTSGRNPADAGYSTALPDGGDAMALAKRFPLLAFLVVCVVAISSAASSASELTDALKARDVAKVRSLIAAGADINEKVQRDYPLNTAAIFGPIEMVAALLDAGADLEKPGRDGLHPLHNAVAMGHKDIVALLLQKGASVAAKDQQGRTPLIYFTANAGTDVGIATLLLTAGADPNVEDADRWTALNYVARYTGNIALAKLLISAGADINHGKDNGETPVGSATFHMHYDLAKFLIVAGADVNKADKDGKSPLSQVTDVAMRQLLIDAGAK
jgi:ankyrin repeat protein